MTFNQSLLNFLTQNNISASDFAREMKIKHVQNVKHLTNPRLNTLQAMQSALSGLTGRTVLFDLNKLAFTF